MIVFRDIRSVLEQALAGGVAARETKRLVQYCAFLALPLVRKKVRYGLLNLGLLAMTEEDIVYDALAELFRRDDGGNFPILQSSFDTFRSDQCSDEEIVDHLRKLVFVNVHKTIIRLYSETDPTLSKILRNLKIGIEKTDVFEETVRFGETVLVIKNADPLLSRLSMGSDDLQRTISSIVNVHDTIPAILFKLHALLAEQDHHQRVVPLFQLATMIKLVYVVGWETEQTVVPTVDEEMDTQRVREIIAQTCCEQEVHLRHSYVETEKISQATLHVYLQTIESILKEEYLDAGVATRSYFDHLVEFAPTVTHAEYRKHHRTMLEYLTKKTRMRLQGLLKAM